MLSSDPASEAEAMQGSGNLGSYRTSLYITNTKLCLGRNGLFPTDTPPNTKQNSAEFNKLRVTTWVSEMEDLRDVIIWVTKHSLLRARNFK